jgi:hypothetical protein
MTMRLTMIFLLIATVGYGQVRTDSVRHNKGKWIAYGLFAVSVASSSVGDGLNSRMKYGSGHALSALSYASIIAIPFVIKRPNWKIPTTYLLLRYAAFDALYNVGAKRNLNYVGGKNFYDESVGKMPLAALHATKAAALGLSIVINLK